MNRLIPAAIVALALAGSAAAQAALARARRCLTCPLSMAYNRVVIATVPRG